LGDISVLYPLLFATSLPFPLARYCVGDVAGERRDRAEAEEFIDAGEAVVVPVRMSGLGRASGAKLELRLAHLWVLRNGKVIRGEVYRTTEEALEAAGVRE
jgi:ketosteroid isomerase-like protein